MTQKAERKSSQILVGCTTFRTNIPPVIVQDALRKAKVIAVYILGLV